MKQKIYISLFAVLYLIVAFSSFWHAVSFFGLANNSWMSVILAFAFEVGQAAVLFSLLTSSKDRSRIMPWVLMTMFTLVQVIGNVFSSYKYLKLNSVENLIYFKEPIFIWTSLPDDQATVIVTYIVGAILPVCALLLTSMITNYLSDQEELKKEQLEEKHIEEITNEIEDKVKDDPQEDPEKHNEDIDIPEEEVRLDEKEFDEFNKDAENIVFKEKNKEIDKLKKEIEDLKHPKIQQIPATEIHEPIPFSEPEGLKEVKQDDNERIKKIKEQPDNDIEQQSMGTTKNSEETKDNDSKEKIKQSHFINLK